MAERPPQVISAHSTRIDLIIHPKWMFKTVNNGGSALVTHHQVIDQDLKIDSYQDLWRNSRREFRR